MSKKIRTILMAALVVAVVLAVGVGSTFAQDQTQQGSGPSTATAPNGQWNSLGVGASRYYAFRYSGDDSQVTIRMQAGKADTVGFEVWTPDNFRTYQQGQTVEPVGTGSVNDALGGDLYWTGSFNTPGTYYVVVRQTGRQLANYNLRISGGSVSFDAGQGNQSGTQSSNAQNSSAQGAAPQTLPVTGNSLQTTSPQTQSQQNQGQQLGRLTQLRAGEQRWFAFNHSGDQGSQIQVRMTSDPKNAVTFEIWTPEQFRSYQNGRMPEAIGGGTANDELNGDQFWTGNFAFAGTYYVIVTNTSQRPANFNLQISGSAVSYPQAGAQAGQSGTQAGQSASQQSGASSQAPQTLPVTGGAVD